MIEPYYQDEAISLYHGDALELVEAWTVGTDVLVTDPPYGIGYESNHNRNPKNVKMGRPVKNDRTTEARDGVLSAWGDGPALVFGRWDIERPSGTRARLVWDKGNSAGMGDLSLPWGRSEEEIYVLGTGFQGKREPNVIRCQMLMSSDRNRPDHPTPKPIALMERLLEKCPPGTVADPFAGSGSTLLAAKRLGRYAVGVEIEERYCEMIARAASQSVLAF